MSKCNNCYHNKVCIYGANYKTAESCKHYVSEYDVVEVVRCKDCYLRKTCYIRHEDIIRTDYGYCSRSGR